MNDITLNRLVELARSPGAVEDTVRYLSEKMRFVRKNERVLICFQSKAESGLGAMLERAVLQRGAVPVMWGDDLRWKALLRLAFSSRVSTIIGPPLVILGLSKLARAKGTPLFVRNVLTAGYPCLDWMIDGIIRGLDCYTWGCFDPGNGSIVAGFSCPKSRGVHIRESDYAVEILDADGTSAPAGTMGDIVLIPKAHPDIRWKSGQQGRLEMQPCPCGCADVRLMDIAPGRDTDPELAALGCELHSWSSILDCRMQRGHYGLELEVIAFPGYQLPKLPSCAKLVVRPWDPERDIPFGLLPDWEIPPFSSENH